MELDLFTFIAQIINFSILIYLLNKFLFGRITKAMDERQAKIAADLSAAETGKKRAEEYLGQSRAEAEKVKAASAGMIREAQLSAEKAGQELLARARDEAGAAKAAWKKEMENEKQAYLDALKVRSGEFMFLLAEKAMNDLAAEELSRKIAEAFVLKIRQIPEDTLEEIRDKVKSVKEPLIVRSSFVINEDLKKRISGAICDKFHRACTVDFADAAGVCGVELLIGGYKVAWSAGQFLREMEEELGEVWNGGKLLSQKPKDKR